MKVQLIMPPGGYLAERWVKGSTMPPLGLLYIGAVLEKEGIDVEFFSGGGTGTYNIDHHVDGFTDVQVGSYIFMDVQYLAIGGKDFSDNFYGDFEPSLTVLTTAISQPPWEK